MSSRSRLATSPAMYEARRAEPLDRMLIWNQTHLRHAPREHERLAPFKTCAKRHTARSYTTLTSARVQRVESRPICSTQRAYERSEPHADRSRLRGLRRR
jgi:hypothetical protein